MTTFDGQPVPTALFKNFSNAAGYTDPVLYTPILTGPVLPGGKTALVIQSPDGTQVWELNPDPTQIYQPAAEWIVKINCIGSGNCQISPLSDWTAPQYYETIQTADVDGDGDAELIARGPFGVRTWNCVNGAFARLAPYGFPAYSGGLENAFTLLNAYLEVPNVRADYATGTNLSTYQTCLVDGNQIVAKPTETCLAASGQNRSLADLAQQVTDADWTTVATEILNEIGDAESVDQLYSQIEAVQTALFLDESNEFPSASTMLLPDSVNNRSPSVNFFGVFADIFAVLGNFDPVVGVTAALLAVTSEFENSSGAPVSLQNSFFVKTYEELEGQMATYQQMMQDNVGFQRTLIAGDANLLQTVAAMVGGELWLIEDTAALSTGRQQFTQWAYQGFAPKFYAFWDVRYCNNEASVHCTAPACGDGDDLDPTKCPNMISWEKTQITSTEFSVNFNGLVSQNGKACHESHNWNDQSCQWDNPPDQPDPGALGTMFTAISVTCTYDAAKETAWFYGCTLGQRDEILANDDSWSFDTYTCTVQAGGGCFNVGVPRLTHGTGMRLGNSSQGKLRMRGEYPLTPDSNYDLRQASLEIEQLIFEPGNTGKGELVLNEKTEPVALLILVPKRNSKRWNAVFETAAGEKPRVRVQLLLRNEKNPWDIVQPVLQMNVRVDGSAIDAPVLCEVGEGSAELQTALRLRVGEADEPLLSKQVWNCYTRHDGTIGMLVAVKAPPVTRPPEGE